MNNADLMEILGIADQIETTGGWQIAAVKLRAFVGEHKALESALREIVRDGDYTAPEGMKRIARRALGSELQRD